MSDTRRDDRTSAADAIAAGYPWPELAEADPSAAVRGVIEREAARADAGTLDTPIIIDRKPADDGHGAVVIAYTGPRQCQPWVTWWESPEGVHYTGHYHAVLSDAAADFRARRH